MLNLLDVVAITKDVPECNVSKGEQGTIVMVYADSSEAYEVEFLDEEGYTKCVLTLEPDEIVLSR